MRITAINSAYGRNLQPKNKVGFGKIAPGVEEKLPKVLEESQLNLLRNCPAYTIMSEGPRIYAQLNMDYVDKTPGKVFWLGLEDEDFGSLEDLQIGDNLFELYKDTSRATANENEKIRQLNGTDKKVSTDNSGLPKAAWDVDPVDEAYFRG